MNLCLLCQPWYCPCPSTCGHVEQGSHGCRVWVVTEAAFWLAASLPYA